MKMFLTRLGDGSQVVITGDVTQVDLPPATESGLIEAVRVLSSIREIGFMKFEASDVVRHPLVQSIVEAYDHVAQVKARAANTAKTAHRRPAVGVDARDDASLELGAAKAEVDAEVEVEGSE
jgi:phosphate starvation-inducible PhoH-like protein